MMMMQGMGPMSSFDPGASAGSRFGGGMDRFDEMGLASLKRRRMDAMGELEAPLSSAHAVKLRTLEEENSLLLLRVDELNREVGELKATNKVLLEHTARLKMEKSGQQPQTSMSSQMGMDDSMQSRSQLGRSMQSYMGY